ncbi:unnamed protein product [Camellia sinensis]
MQDTALSQERENKSEEFNSIPIINNKEEEQEEGRNHLCGGSKSKTREMTWHNDSEDEEEAGEVRFITCPSCGHNIELQNRAGIEDLPGLPAGVKFDPSDQEILEHLEAKVSSNAHKIHPLIDEFIPTIEGENGICYTHPEKLPG